MISNPDMEPAKRVAHKPWDGEWAVYQQKGPRICIAVVRPLRKRTRRAQRNRILRKYVDTMFSCQYKCTGGASKPVVTFSGKSVIIGAEGSAEKMVYAIPQLEWNNSK